MYSVNGTPLDNPAMGWRLMRPTRPLIDLLMERANVRVPGRHGTIAGMPASLAPPVLLFVVQTPLAGLEALQALWLHGNRLTYTGRNNRVAVYEFLSSKHVPFGPGAQSVQLTVSVRLAEVFWRDANEIIGGLVSLTGPSVNVDAWPGSSGLVTDAIVRVRGPFNGLQVRSGGTWFSHTGPVDAGHYLRFHSAEGRGFITTSDTWNGGTEVSGSIDFDGPDGSFQIAPHFTNPATRVARVEVTTTSRGAGAAAQLRGKGAYLA